MTDTTATDCVSCQVVGDFVKLAGGFTQDLSTTLMPAMWVLLLSVTGLWIVIQGLRLVIHKTTIVDVAYQGVFVILSALLLGGQGPGFVKSIYDAALGTMGAAASMALSVGSAQLAGQVGVDGSGQTIGSGMVALVEQTERGIRHVLSIAWEIAGNAKVTNFFLPAFYALALAVPFIVLIVHYASQVVVSIFRVMMLATLAPFMMLGIGFGWGRDLAMGGVRSVIAAFLVLFASTGAISLVLYAVTKIDALNKAGVSGRDLTDTSNPEFWAYLLAVVLGWAGIAFLVEATGIANSLTGSLFSSAGAGMLTAGVVGTGAFLGKKTLSAGRSAIGGFFGNVVGDPIANRVKNSEMANKIGDLIDRYKGVKKP